MGEQDRAPSRPLELESLLMCKIQVNSGGRDWPEDGSAGKVLNHEA